MLNPDASSFSSGSEGVSAIIDAFLNEDTDLAASFFDVDVNHRQVKRAYTRLREMAREAMRELPEEITVYRVGEHRSDSPYVQSFTLNEQQARSIQKYKSGDVSSYVVHKEDIQAHVGKVLESVKRFTLTDTDDEVLIKPSDVRLSWDLLHYPTDSASNIDEFAQVARPGQIWKRELLRPADAPSVDPEESPYTDTVYYFAVLSQPWVKEDEARPNTQHNRILRFWSWDEDTLEGLHTIIQEAHETDENSREYAYNARYNDISGNIGLIENKDPRTDKYTLIENFEVPPFRQSDEGL